MESQTSVERSNFATNSRLISCLVTECLLRALYVPFVQFGAVGFAVILGHEVSPRPYGSTDILAVVLLRGVPIFKHNATDPREIGLLDPLDMMPQIFEIDSDGTTLKASDDGPLTSAILDKLTDLQWPITANGFFRSHGPLSIWEKYAESIDADPDLNGRIKDELASAVKWQQYAYENPPPVPTFSSSSIEWEQSLVEGHHGHPMHKSRTFLPPLPDLQPGAYDLYHPVLRLIAVPRDNLHITYNFEDYIQPIVAAVSQRAGKTLPVNDDHVVIPVHELQLTHIKDKFSNAIVFPEEFNLPALAQANLRGLIIPDAYRDLALKLAVGVKLTSAVRTISPASAYLGPRFSRKIVPLLALDPKIATVARELASVVHINTNGEVAKHCAAIIRESYENSSEESGERMIVCVALTQCNHSSGDGNVPAIIRVFGLHTEEKRLHWLSKFVRVLFESFLPCLMHNGVGFECHPQNLIARFNIITKELLGFVIRDFGGLRVHPETLKSSTGANLDAHTGHSIIANDLEDVYTRMYHAMIHNHLQQLIRVLGLHYNGLGWKAVRTHLEELIPRDHKLYTAWLDPERKTIPVKSFMRMQMAGMYRFHIQWPFPNLLLYPGTVPDS